MAFDFSTIQPAVTTREKSSDSKEFDFATIGPALDSTKDRLEGSDNPTPMALFDEALAREEQETDFTAEEVDFLESQQGAPQATFDQAMFWADRYNADASIPLSERIRMFKDKQDVEVLPSVTSAIHRAVDSGAFSKEMESRGLDRDTVVAALENISKVETSGGRNNKISSGMAGGILQVIPSTFKDLLDRGVIGPKALKAIGRTKEELLEMSDREKAEFLQSNDDAAAMFGLGAFLNKMERSDES